MMYHLVKFKQSDMFEVVGQVVPRHMIGKYLNQTKKTKIFSCLGILHSELYLLKDEKGTIVAAGVIRTKRTPFQTKWLYGIEVKNDLQGRGIGTELIKALLDKARSEKVDSVQLKVDKNNHKAIRLYSKFDFRQIKSGKNTIIMRLKLS